MALCLPLSEGAIKWQEQTIRQLKPRIHLNNKRKSIYVHKSHNVTVLLYHLVFPTKYRRLVINDAVDKLIRDICLEIGKRYEIHFVEIGTDKDHVHFLVQSIPMLTVTQIVTIIKSITARRVFDTMPEMKKGLWGSSLWTSGYYACTVGKHGNVELWRREYNQVQPHSDTSHLLQRQ